MPPNPECENSGVSRKLPHAPLLWGCIPFLAGLALGKAFPDVSFKTMGATAFCLLAAAAIVSWLPRPRRWAWALCFLPGVALLAWAYYAWRVPPLPQPWKVYPPREISAQIEIDRLYASSASRYPSVRGLGRLRETPPWAKDLEGRRVYFHVFSQDQELLPSAVIQVCGVLKTVDPAVSPFADYLAANGIRMEVSRCLLQGVVKPPNAVARLCQQLNRRCADILTEGFFKEYSGIFAAMLLGKSGALTREQKADFTLTGTLHLFAISGLHVALIGAVLFFFLRVARVPASLLPWLVLPLLFLYVGATGFMPSALRAFAMIAFLWGARLCGRPNEGLSSLAASALCLLAYDPACIGNAGFQLSYAVVASILLYGVPLTQALQCRFEPYRDMPAEFLGRGRRCWAWLQKSFWATLAVSLAAFLLSAPLCMEIFGTFALGGVLLNLLLVPLATPVLAAGIVSLLFGLAGAPEFVVALPNAIGVGLTQLMAWCAGRAHDWLPLLFQQPAVPLNGFGFVSTILLLAMLIVWRKYLDGKPLWYFLLPFGLWGYLTAWACL